MSTKDCFWSKFRRTCPTPNACQLPQIPSSCDECGWHGEAAWELCKKTESEIAKLVDEIIAEEEAITPPDSHKDYLHDDLFYRLHKRNDPF